MSCIQQYSVPSRGVVEAVQDQKYLKTLREPGLLHDCNLSFSGRCIGPLWVQWALYRAADCLCHCLLQLIYIAGIQTAVGDDSTPNITHSCGI